MRRTTSGVARGVVSLGLAVALASACGGPSLPAGGGAGGVGPGLPSPSGPGASAAPSGTAASGGAASGGTPAGGTSSVPAGYVVAGYAGMVRGRGIVLEGGGHGPQLCADVVQQSYPPQCTGPDILGWRWSAVAHHTAGGVRWTDEVVVQGRLHGDALVFVGRAVPASGGDVLPVEPRQPCPLPPGVETSGVRTSGPRAAVEPAVACRVGDPREAARLGRVAAELAAAGSGQGRGSRRFWSVRVDEMRGRVDAVATLAWWELHQQLDRRYGSGTVHLTGLFEPVR